MSNIVQTFDSSINYILENYVRKPTLIKAIVQLLLMLYAVRLAPVPPPVVLQLFNNVYFKVFIFALILWTAQVSPSTSILIAIAFMITVNYTTTGKIWEMMDNIPSIPIESDDDEETEDIVVNQNVKADKSVTPEQSVEAIKILSTTALSPVAIPVSQIVPIANIALSNISTVDGATAVQALSKQSTVPVAGVPNKVSDAVNIAIADATSPKKVDVTPAQSIEAIKILSTTALSPVAIPASQIVPIANVALSNISSPKAEIAIKALVEQSTLPVAGDDDKVDEAVEIAIADVDSNKNVTPAQSIEAIKILSTTALSPVAIPASQIVPIANVALSNISSPKAKIAIKALLEQSTLPVAGDDDKVDEAVEVAVADVASKNTITVPVITSESQITKAIQTLGDSASSSSATPASIILPIATVVASTMTTPLGVAAVKALAEQSVVPEAGTPAKISEALNIAVKSMDISVPSVPSVQVPSTSCYPLRNYDMSKISPMRDGALSSFEDYQEFKSTSQ